MRGRTSNRVRTALVGAASAAAIVAGVAVAAIPGNGDESASGSDVQLVQNTTQGLVVGQAVDLDLKQVVEKRIGGTVPPGTTLKLSGLPDGLKQDGWNLVGTPTKSGLFNVHIEVTSLGKTSAQDVQLMVAPRPGEKPGGVVTSPGATTTPGTTTPSTTTPAAEDTETDTSDTETSGTETSDTETSGTETDATETVVPTETDTDTSDTETSDTEVPTEDSGSLGGGIGDLCDSDQLSDGIEQMLPTVLGESTDEGTANLIAGLIGSLLPSLIGTASADGGPCGDVAATGSIADGVGSLGDLGIGESSEAGTEEGSVQVGPTEGDFDLQSVLQMVELANGIMDQVGGR